MPPVLTNASTIQCAHTAKAILTSGAKLKVLGSSVLLDGQTISLTPGACTQVGTNLTPCTTVTVASGKATKLTVGGVAVLLETITGKTDGNPVFTFTASAGHSKLKAV